MSKMRASHGSKSKTPYVPLDPFAQVYDPDRDFRNKVVSDVLWTKAKKGNRDMSCSMYAPEWMKDGLGIPTIPKSLTDKEIDEFYRRRPESKPSLPSAASMNCATPSPQQQTALSSNPSSSRKAEIGPSLTIAESKARLGGKGPSVSRWAIDTVAPSLAPILPVRPNRAISIRSPYEKGSAPEDQSSPLTTRPTTPSKIPTSPPTKHDGLPQALHAVTRNQEIPEIDVNSKVQTTTKHFIDSEFSSYGAYLRLRKDVAPHFWHTVPGFQASPPKTYVIREVKKTIEQTTLLQHNRNAFEQANLTMSSDKSISQTSESSSYESYLILRKNVAPHFWHNVPGFQASPTKTNTVREVQKTTEQTAPPQYHPNASEQKENYSVSPKAATTSNIGHPIESKSEDEAVYQRCPGSSKQNQQLVRSAEVSSSEASDNHSTHLLLKKTTAPHFWHPPSSHQASDLTDINHDMENKSKDKVTNQHCAEISEHRQELTSSESSCQTSDHCAYLILKKNTAPHFWHTLPGYQAYSKVDIRLPHNTRPEPKLTVRKNPKISGHKQELAFPAEKSSSQACDITSTASSKKILSSHLFEATVSGQPNFNSERSVVATAGRDTSKSVPTTNFKVEVFSQTADNIPTATRLQDKVVISEVKLDYVLPHMRHLHPSIQKTASAITNPPPFEAKKVVITSKLVRSVNEKVRLRGGSATKTKPAHIDVEKVASAKIPDDSGLASGDDFLAAFLKSQIQKSQVQDQPPKVPGPLKVATPPRRNPLTMNCVLLDTNVDFYAATKSKQQKSQQKSKAKACLLEENQAAVAKPASDDNPANSITKPKIYTLQEYKAAAVKPASDGHSVKSNMKFNEAQNSIAELILAQNSAQRDLASSSGPLTKSALAAVSGLPTPSGSGPTDTFNISVNGVSDQMDEKQPKEGVRAQQGLPATKELLDWDGTMVPPPCDWENDRTKFDTSSFVDDYVMEWNAVVRSLGPDPPVDISDLEFTSLKCGDVDIEKGKLLPCWEHNYITIPDEKFSEDNEKRENQTSESVIEVAIRQKKAQEAREKELKEAYKRRELEIAAQEPEPNAFAPKINMYLRPATIRDQEQIARIYNHYVGATHIMEDIHPIQPETAAWMVYNTHEAGMPFIVAVRGNAPSMQDAQGRTGSSKNSVMPAHENIIGFTLAEDYSKGWNGSRAGRSRATANLQIYVDHRYTRKGVGRNMLDRMMYSLNPTTYSFENTCDWVDPNRSRIYNGGLGTWHQLTIQLSILKEKDPNYDGVVRFLASKFFFMEQARLASVGRTYPHRDTPSQWLDLVFFQTQATHGEVVAIDY